MSEFGDILTMKTDLLSAAVVSAVVSAGVSYWLKRKEIRHSAKVEYEYEERKRLRKLIGRHHGRLLNAANSMNYRMWNLYTNYDREWLSVDGDFANSDYYFRSTVYRFLNVCAHVRMVEREALLLDARIAQKHDFAFLNYVAALHWVMTDIALVEGLHYDDFHQTDHFFSDHFRIYCDLCLCDGQFPEMEEFSEFQRSGSKIEPVLQYFDGLTREEARLRWDRLVAFHLLLMAFINAFGYRRQHSNAEQFRKVVKQIQNKEILHNLVKWLPRHDLDKDTEAKKIIQAAKSEAEYSLMVDCNGLFDRNRHN